MIDIRVPDELVESQHLYAGEPGRAFIAALPARVREFVERWELTVDGDPMHGMAALVLPVVCADGTPAAVKFQLLDEETEGEPVALRVWDGDGAVRLLDHDAATGTMLLERLDSGRMLSTMADTRKAVLVLAELLARLTATPAPEGMRRLGDIAAEMVDDLPQALRTIADPAERALVERCGGAVREVMGEPGDRMLHWDLHFENVLASDREPWLAIDPKPLAGDPGFDLWPAIDNKFDADDVLWRFDAMTEVLSLDRERARAWTLGRVLQNALWEAEDGRPMVADDMEIARRLLGR
ncbi:MULTISPECIES: aminoglycoside phosphotransferase family protein [Streptomyces]|uniref:Hydroxyurea phosphotransferase n=1 Tax=Streptomyces venezuelae TaxID=54571 RepID=A0A5P2BBS5_STRVZ|nr:aminoglycoside phosphotransferase family protein [Streptomyces venezuelae]MYY83407.1 hydroxyurea phosphotransferase [Streptomyces sp. SID335]MYZ14753.1 hydroxyurea phosphotransferase [Streptomyces sp. SID337]NDZ84755.1 hydroxyurea phosphotransferase [Streptomyces sp. SID10115]NDZ98731.1 hydroxyurea phosphotransferase [Streptomyces sp. SID10116]NEB43052.1 hydroxyurea phosphotransferase [Streptomyces sp. SID339]